MQGRDTYVSAVAVRDEALLFKYGTFELVDVIDRREFAAWLRLVDGDLRAVALDDQQRAYLAKMGIQVDGH